MASYGSRPTSGKRSAEFHGEIRAERSTPSSRDGVETASAFRGEISCSWQKFCDENNPCYFRHISRPLAPQGANAVLKPYARVGPSAWPTCRANEHPAPVVYRVPWGQSVVSAIFRKTRAVLRFAFNEQNRSTERLTSRGIPRVGPTVHSARRSCAVAFV